jgi:hypothetical protein
MESFSEFYSLTVLTGVFVRAFSEQQYDTLKRACDVGYVVAGGHSLFLRLTRLRGTSQLTKYASSNEDDRDTYMPLDVAVDLDRASRTPIVTGAMAALLGYRLEPLSASIIDTEKLTERDAHNILSEAMDVSKALLAAFADGRIDALERKQLRREIRELIRAAEVILAKLEDGDGQ